MLRSRLRLAAVGSSVALATGCYTMQPVINTPPALGTVVALDITDQGRVALGGSMGPEIAQVQGRLIARPDSGYVVGVRSIRTIAGNDQVWAGEPVFIRNDYVRSASQRKFSAGRTAVASAVGVAAVAAIVATSLNGFSTGDSGQPGQKGDSASAQRNPRSGAHLPSRSPSSGPRAVPQIIRP